MKKLRLSLMTVGMVGLLAAAACSDTVPEDADDAVGDVPTTLAEPTATTEGTDPTEADTGSDPAELAARLQLELATLGEEIQASEGAEELQTAWTEVEAQVSSALADIQEGTIDTDGLESQLDEFQSTLDAMGGDVGSEVREAWTNLRSSLEELMG